MARFPGLQRQESIPIGKRVGQGIGESVGVGKPFCFDRFGPQCPTDQEYTTGKAKAAKPPNEHFAIQQTLKAMKKQDRNKKTKTESRKWGTITCYILHDPYYIFTFVYRHMYIFCKIHKSAPFPLHWGAECVDFHKPSADPSKAIQTRKQGSSAAACFSVYRLFCPGAVVICEQKSQMQQKAMVRNCFFKQIQRFVQGLKSQGQGQPPHILQDSVGFLSNIFLGNRCRSPNCLS